MNALVKFAIFAMVIALSSAADWPCPVEGLDFHGYDIECQPKGSVDSWQECGKLCNDLDECKFWTLRNNDDICCLKSSDEFIIGNNAAISGEKGCM